jgi:DNA-binding CsgD family transcriptional regulator
MFLGREDESAELDRLLDAARRGESGALILRGEAGSGKSALCEYAVTQAADMTVLRARGVESESEIAFSGLWDVFRPVVGRLDAIPEPQAAALAGALALGPPATASGRHGVGGGIPVDRFTVCAATLSLLAVVAEDEPVLGVIDDAQWLDRPSGEALLFAARRLEAEGVVVLFALRDGQPSTFDRAGLRELQLRGLDADAARTLLNARARVPIAPEVSDRLVAATAGNPLALAELPATLTDAQLAGTEPLEEPLRPGPSIEQAFRHRIAALPADAQRGLVVAAASESADLEVVLRAAEELGLEPDALDTAEAAGLVRLNGERLEFRDPLVRSVVYHGAPTATRRAVHQALARVSSGPQTSAWHLAAATSAPDDEVARALADAAATAGQRGGHAAAASALERAAALTPNAEERVRRLLQAADESRLAGQVDRAVELLEQALAAVTDPRLEADINHLRGTVETWRGNGAKAHALLVAEAARVEPLDPAKATMMLVDAAAPLLLAGDARAALETARKAVAVGERAGGAAELLAWALLANALILTGEAAEGHPLLMRCQSLVGERELPLRAYQLIQFAGVSLLCVEEYDIARDLLARVVDQARARSAPAILPYALVGLTELDYRTGNWAAAYAAAAEAHRLATETGQTSALPFSLIGLARVEAPQGRREECEAHVRRGVEAADAAGAGSAGILGDAILGLLNLGLGDAERAIVHFEEVGRTMEAKGLLEPALVPWEPNLIEAYVRVGRRDDAEQTVAAFGERAERAERTMALAAAARCRGLLADEGFEEAFEDALAWHERTPTPFERARTELCLGERRRRARHPSDAREPLRAALETFERLGATPWAERARSELRASGETTRRRDPSAAQQLTPQELQVALMVAQGATNREAGAALFLSPKTIEAHLSRVYRKLNVRSRTELASLLAGEGAFAEVA